MFDLELLLCLDAHVGRREEKRVLLETDGWRITETLELNLLHVDRRVVKDELRRKVVEARRFRAKFKDNNLE